MLIHNSVYKTVKSYYHPTIYYYYIHCTLVSYYSKNLHVQLLNHDTKLREKNYTALSEKIL